MATYNFVVDGRFVNISGVANTHARLHNSSQAIEWFYDGSGDLVFSIDDAPYLVKDMSEVIIDGVTLTDPSEFETNIKLIFPGYAAGSVVGYPDGTKIYMALLTQSGTDAPVATVLMNTLGGTVVWTYNGNGSYIATLSGAFPASKTWLIINNTQPEDSGPWLFIRGTDNTITLNNTNGENNSMSNTPIQIIVFP
jgi:hypothetical protein